MLSVALDQSVFMGCKVAVLPKFNQSSGLYFLYVFFCINGLCIPIYMNVPIL